MVLLVFNGLVKTVCYFSRTQGISCNSEFCFFDRNFMGASQWV